MATDDLLAPLDSYLGCGIHIGSKYRTGDMGKFIYKTRQDGLHVLNIQTVNERIDVAASFLAQYDPKDILVVAGRAYAQAPAEKFAEVIGAVPMTGRFVPGALTNPDGRYFREPKIVFVADAPADRQAILEAKITKIPVLALCDVNNLLRNIDLAIPLNNKGKKALALVYFLLAREVLKRKGVIKKDSEFKYTIEDFETQIEDENKEEKKERRR